MPQTTDVAASSVIVDDKDGLGRRLREAWHKTVGTWATDEKGTASLVTRLVEFRTLSTEEARRVLAVFLLGAKRGAQARRPRRPA